MHWWYRNLLPCTVLFFLLSCEGSRGPMGPPGEGYDALTDERIKPVIIFTYPSDGSTGPNDVYNQIQIRFNKIMDIASLRRAIQFTSSLNDISTDTTSIVSLAGDLIVVSAGGPMGSKSGFRWRIGQPYTMTISTKAVDVNGNHLVYPHSMTFTPEPYFRIRIATPKDHTFNISTRPKIRLTFNSLLDSSILPAVSITPSINGTWRAQGVNLSFLPDFSTRLEVGTEYTISLSVAGQDYLGNSLPSPANFRFTTIPFRVSSTLPINGAVAMQRTSPISFTLTGPVDTSTIRSAITLVPDVLGTMSYYSPGNRIYFTPAVMFAPAKVYTVTLSTSLLSSSGKNLSAPFTLSFSTGEELSSFP